MVCIDLHPRLLWSICCLGSGVNRTPAQWRGGDSFSVWPMLSILTRVWWYLVFFLKHHYHLEAQDYELILTFIDSFQMWMCRKVGLAHILKKTNQKKRRKKLKRTEVFVGLVLFNTFFLATLMVLSFTDCFFTYGTDWHLVPSSSLYLFIKPTTLESHP